MALLETNFAAGQLKGSVGEMVSRPGVPDFLERKG